MDGNGNRLKIGGKCRLKTEFAKLIVENMRKNDYEGLKITVVDGK